MVTSHAVSSGSVGRPTSVEALRRVDWRFLLDRALPERALYVGSKSDNLLGGLREFGIEVEVFSPSILRAEPYGLVVMKDPDWAVVTSEVGQLLAPGGVVYGEITRRPGARRRADRSLRRTGLTAVDWYWHHPGFERCKRIISPDAPAAVEYGISRSGAPAKGLLSTAASHLSRWGVAGHLVPATSFIAHRRGEAQGEFGGITAFLESAWERLDLKRFGSISDLESVLITPRFAASAHVVAIYLNRRNGRPVLVVKTPRSAAGVGALSAEASGLREVYRRWPDADGSFPVCLAFESYGDAVFLVETGLDGSSLSAAGVRKHPASSQAAIVEWATTLSERTARPGNLRGATGRLALKPLATWRDASLGDAATRQLVDRTRRIVARLDERVSTLVVEHGDLSAPNLLLDRKGRLQVVDWELAEPNGLPGFDLFFALTFIASALANARTVPEHLAAFEAAFFGEDAWATPHVRHYARRLSIPSQAITPLFVTACSRWATRMSGRLEAAGGSDQPLVGSSVAGRFAALWLHAVKNETRLGWQPGGRPHSGVPLC